MRCTCVSVCREDHQGLRILSDYLLYCQREHGRHRRSWKCLDNLSAKVAIKANNRPRRSLPQSYRTSLFSIPQVNTHNTIMSIHTQHSESRIPLSSVLLKACSCQIKMLCDLQHICVSVSNCKWNECFVIAVIATLNSGAALMQQTSHISHLAETELAVTICGEIF